MLAFIQLVSSIAVLDHVFRVNLVLLEDHEDGGVVRVVHAAVVQTCALSVLGRGTLEAALSLGELSDQHLRSEHNVLPVFGFGIVVGIRGISCEVAAFPISRAVSATHPPVEVLLTDGL